MLYMYRVMAQKLFLGPQINSFFSFLKETKKGTKNSSFLLLEKERGRNEFLFGAKEWNRNEFLSTRNV